MSEKQKLNRKQLAVIDELVGGELDEQQILNKYNLSRSIYNKWQSNEQFLAELDRRIDWLGRQSAALIARYASVAAAKLIGLTESDNAETARKACLDILNLPKTTAGKGDGRGTIDEGRESSIENQVPNTAISPETASRLLAVLAEDENNN